MTETLLAPKFKLIPTNTINECWSSADLRLHFCSFKSCAACVYSALLWVNVCEELKRFLLTSSQVVQVLCVASIANEVSLNKNAFGDKKIHLLYPPGGKCVLASPHHLKTLSHSCSLLCPCFALVLSPLFHFIFAFPLLCNCPVVSKEQQDNEFLNELIILHAKVGKTNLAALWLRPNTYTQN